MQIVCNPNLVLLNILLSNLLEGEKYLVKNWLVTVRQLLVVLEAVISVWYRQVGA